MKCEEGFVHGLLLIIIAFQNFLEAMSAEVNGAGGEDAAGKRGGRPSCVAVYCGAQEPRKDIYNQTARGERKKQQTNNLFVLCLASTSLLQSLY